jgi:NADH dehydrogenase
MAALRRDAGEAHERFELAGPETLSHTDIVRLVLRSLDRRRMLVHVPTPVVSRALRLLEAAMGTGAFATWDEAELMEVSMISTRGAADAELLGVTPEPMGAVLRTPEGAALPTAVPLRAA